MGMRPKGGWAQTSAAREGRGIGYRRAMSSFGEATEGMTYLYAHTRVMHLPLIDRSSHSPILTSQFAVRLGLIALSLWEHDGSNSKRALNGPRTGCHASPKACEYSQSRHIWPYSRIESRHALRETTQREKFSCRVTGSSEISGMMSSAVRSAQSEWGRCTTIHVKQQSLIWTR